MPTDTLSDLVVDADDAVRKIRRTLQKRKGAQLSKAKVRPTESAARWLARELQQLVAREEAMYDMGKFDLTAMTL